MSDGASSKFIKSAMGLTVTELKSIVEFVLLLLMHHDHSVFLAKIVHTQLHMFAVTLTFKTYFGMLIPVRNQKCKTDVPQDHLIDTENSPEYPFVIFV